MHPQFNNDWSLFSAPPPLDPAHSAPAQEKGQESDFFDFLNEIEGPQGQSPSLDILDPNEIDVTTIKNVVKCFAFIQKTQTDRDAITFEDCEDILRIHQTYKRGIYYPELIRKFLEKLDSNPICFIIKDEKSQAPHVQRVFFYSQIYKNLFGFSCRQRSKEMLSTYLDRITQFIEENLRFEWPYTKIQGKKEREKKDQEKGKIHKYINECCISLLCCLEKLDMKEATVQVREKLQLDTKYPELLYNYLMNRTFRTGHRKSFDEAVILRTSFQHIDLKKQQYFKALKQICILEGNPRRFFDEYRQHRRDRMVMKQSLPFDIKLNHAQLCFHFKTQGWEDEFEGIHKSFQPQTSDESPYKYLVYKAHCYAQINNREKFTETVNRIDLTSHLPKEQFKLLVEAYQLFSSQEALSFMEGNLSHTNPIKRREAWKPLFAAKMALNCGQLKQATNLLDQASATRSVHGEIPALRELIRIRSEEGSSKETQEQFIKAIHTYPKNGTYILSTLAI